MADNKFFKTEEGNAGEAQQIATGGTPAMTTNFGVPISDNANSLKAGARGPTLLEDFVLREKIFHFDHERIPERIVHARGSAAHGYFECTDPIPELSRASLFAKKGKKTPVFTRFSTVAGGAGQLGDGFGAFEIAMRAGAAGVDDPLRDTFMVEMEDLFAQHEIFQQGRPARPGLERVLIVGHRNAVIGGQGRTAPLLRFAA